MLMLLFCFNLSRGISSCAWLPWITALVPASLRGKYLARDAGVQNLASFLTFLFAAGCLARSTRSWQFSILFAFSAIMGAVSLSFLKRIPDAEIPPEFRSSKAPVPWGAMLRYPPFRKLLVTLVSYSAAYGGMTAFTVAFLKTEAGMSECEILLVTSVSFLGGLCSLWFLGLHLDRLGSKPILAFCFAAWVAVLAGWIAISGGLMRVELSVMLVLQFLMGLLAALVQMSNTRLAMVVIPVMGRSHFFALYSVIGNVTLGLAPIAWGLLINAVGARSPIWLGLAWNRYTVFFAATCLAFLCTLVCARRLDEPQAAGLEELLREDPLRVPPTLLAPLLAPGGA